MDLLQCQEPRTSVEGFDAPKKENTLRCLEHILASQAPDGGHEAAIHPDEAWEFGKWH